MDDLQSGLVTLGPNASGKTTGQSNATIQPQYLTAEMRASTERALAARSMPGVLSTAARVASQIRRDGPQTTDLLRFVAHVMGSTAVLCYVHTPIGPRAVLYKPMHVPITCMVELFLWSGHCILLVPPGPGTSTPWVEARQHVDRLLQFMRVDHAWCMSFGVYKLRCKFHNCEWSRGSRTMAILR